MNYKQFDMACPNHAKIQYSSTYEGKQGSISYLGSQEDWESKELVWLQKQKQKKKLVQHLPGGPCCHQRLPNFFF